MCYTSVYSVMNADRFVTVEKLTDSVVTVSNSLVLYMSKM